jgi:photosystem II stability/assembly factor-like uncharacterized protein
MIRKFLGLLYLLILNYTAISFAQTQPWVELQSPVSTTLKKLSFVDSLTGWATGEAGIIIRTMDGGNSWEIQNSNVQTFITDIFFLDKNLGWATTIEDVFPFYSVILKTTNGGEDWQLNYFPDPSTHILTIFFVDSLNGFVGGSDIAYTTDGGDIWLNAEIDSNMVSGYPIYNFNFYNRQFGYACGGRLDAAGVIWRTTNSGVNWKAQGVSSDEVFDLFLFDSLNALTLSGDPEGLFFIANIKTTDAGMTWSNDSLSFVGLSFAIDFRTYNEGWSASGYKFLVTTDRGDTWDELPTPGGVIIYDLQFTDARTGYAVGDGGVILKTDPTHLGINTEKTTPNDFSLYQNYPNPFNPETNIRFDLEKRAIVSLIVYDYLGNEIAILINEEKMPGSYEIKFDPTTLHLVSGIYFYQLRTRSSVQTKKMVYLK